MTSLSKFKEEVEKEFDKKFIYQLRFQFRNHTSTINFWKSDNQDTAFTGVGNIKSFINNTIDQAVKLAYEQYNKEIVDQIQNTTDIKDITVRLYEIIIRAMVNTQSKQEEFIKGK